MLLTGVVYKPNGAWEIDKNTVESAKLVSKSPQKIEVKLNPKAVWSDGKPITWQDMVDTWKALNGSNPKYQIITDNGFKDISSIEKGDDEYSYTITYKKVNADWPNYMYPIGPSSLTSDPTVFNTAYAKKMFPSNGPFVVSNIDANAGVVTETPNPKWWGQKPKLDKVIFRVVNQDSLGQAFANKEINVLDTQANPDVLAQAKQRSDAEIQKSGGLTWTHLTFNGTRAPLNDVHVRRAIAQAIDRKTMAAVIQKELDVTPSVQGSVVYVPGQAGYKDVADEELPLQPEGLGRTAEGGRLHQGLGRDVREGRQAAVAHDHGSVGHADQRPAGPADPGLPEEGRHRPQARHRPDGEVLRRLRRDREAELRHDVVQLAGHAVPGVDHGVAVQPGQRRPELHGHHRSPSGRPLGQGERRARPGQAAGDRPTRSTR